MGVPPRADGTRTARGAQKGAALYAPGGELSKIILASTLTFFITFYATFSGLRAVEPAYKDVALFSVVPFSRAPVAGPVASTPTVGTRAGA